MFQLCHWTVLSIENAKKKEYQFEHDDFNQNLKKVFY